MTHRSIIIKTIVLLLAALVISGCGGAESRKAKYLEKGKAYMEQKNYDKAVIELKNALQIDPKLAEAYYLIGAAEEARQNWERSFGSYAKAVELDSNHLEARARLGRLYLMSGNTDEATKMAEAILTSQPKSVAGRTLKAAIMAKKQDTEGAIREVSGIISEDPTQTEAIGLLASVYLQQKAPDKAIDTLIKGIASNPKNIPLRMQLVNVYGLDSKNLDKIEPIIREIISLDPGNFQYQRSLASFYAQTNQVDKAEKTLREAIQADPEDIDRYLLLSELLATRKSVAAAETELLAAIKLYPEAYKLHFALAKLYEAAEAYDKVAQTYRAVIDASGTEMDGLHARNLLAELLLKQGQRAEAEKLTEEVLKENPNDNDGLTNKARLSLMRKDPDSAITALRQVLRDQPASVEANTLLANAHLQKKETELAKESLLKSVELNPRNIQARLAYAQFLAQNKDIDGALKVTGETLKFAPNDLDVLMARMELYAAKRDLKNLQSTIADIKAKHPDRAVGYFQMGRYYMSQKRYDDAIREFELALGKSRDPYQVLSAIVSAHVAQGKPDKAISRLNDILKETPSHPFAHELLAEVYITKKQYPEAEKSLHEAIRNNPKWNIPYRNLANLYLVRGDMRVAAEIYQKGLEAIPDDAQLLFHLAETYERTRDYDKALSTYERILQKNPNSDVAANNAAALLVDHKGDAASLKRAKELALRFETSSQLAFMDTLGWVYYKTGEVDKAVDLLKKVVKLAPDAPIFRYHLGMAYHKQGNLSEAKIQLAKAMESKNDFTGKDEARTTLQQIP